MILNNDSTTVQTIGDIQENQIRINPENLDHIVSILSTNLYSSPEESFLRETISNAVDSHIEAGTTEPVILSFTNSSDDAYAITIRDYGTGISPERFKEIYLCIGSSTKRSDNQYIGAFGIGRFSAISCADMVHITSFYNGKAYYYIMMKNGTKINIDLISVNDTDEQNGLEVRIVVETLNKYIGALPYLYYFDNLYVYSNCKSTLKEVEIENFNHRKITKFKNFAIRDVFHHSYESKLVLGKVLYDYYPNKTDYTGYNELLSQIDLLFDIGELDVTPNREQLLYSEKTIKALTNKIAAAVEEIKEYAVSEQKDLDDILMVWKLNKEDKFINLPNVDVKLNVGSVKEIADVMQFSYKGLSLTKNITSAIGNLMWHSVDIPSCIVMRDGEILTDYRKKRLNFRDALFRYSSFKIILLPSMTGTKSCHFREFIKQKYNQSDSIVIFCEKPNISAPYIKNCDFVSEYSMAPVYYDDANNYNKVNKAATIWLYHQVLLTLSKYSEELDIINSDEYIQFKNNKKSEKVRNQKFSESVRFYINIADDYDYIYHYRQNFQSISEVISFINRKAEKGAPVLYGCSDNPLFSLLKLKNNEGKFVTVRVSKTNMKHLKEIPKQWMPIEKIINVNTPEVIRVITFNQLKPNNFSYSDFNRILRNTLWCLPEYEAKVLKLILDYHPKVTAESLQVLNDFAKEFSQKKIPYDSDIEEGFKVYNKYSKIADKLWNINSLSSACGYLFAYIAMKKKLIRLNNETYQHIRKYLNFDNNENN